MKLPKLTRPQTAKRRRSSERRYFVAAAIAAALIALATYGAFVKQWLSDPFILRGAFASANELQPGNPVRIAGLAIGSVTAVGPGPHNTAVVTMQISNPSELRADASLAIEPRLLFEGNFYVDVNPGTPAATAMRSGTTVPISRTTFPVQIDQVLDVLNQPTRDSLVSTISALSGGLGPSQAHATAGAGYQGLRVAISQLDATLPSVTEVAQAAQGTSVGDLPRAIGSSRDLVSELTTNPGALSDLVTSDAKVFTALSANEQALADDIADLDHVTESAPATFSALDRALPSLTTFATQLRPALRAAPLPLTRVTGLLTQVKALTARDVLAKLLPALTSVTGALPTLEQQLDQLFPQVTALSTCTTHAVVPALNLVLQDGANTTGQPAWQELLHMTAGLAGASEGFDGNGSAIRLGVTEGPTDLTAVLPDLGDLASSFAAEGVRPAWLGFGVLPAFRPDASCDQQSLPDVNMAGNSAAYPLRQSGPVASSPLTSTLDALLFGSAGQRARALAQLLGSNSRLGTPTSRSHSTATDSATTPGPAPTTATTPATTTATASTTTSQPTTPAQNLVSSTDSAVNKLLGKLFGGKAGGQ